MRKIADVMAPTRSKAAITALEGATEATEATGAAGGGDGMASAAGAVTRSFRSVDIDGDGIPDEPLALTKFKGIGGAAHDVIDGRETGGPDVAEE